MDRRVVYGLGAVGLYLAAVLATAHFGVVPQRPLYDGLAPPSPYRYVRPPPDLADSNEPALRGRSAVPLTPEMSLARTVVTDDGQMLVVFPDGAVAPREGETEISVRITPLDPAPFPPGPGDLEITGNAYRVDASYARSRSRVALRKPMTAVLRYPTHATVMLRRDGRTWRRLKTQTAQASLQLFAESRKLGTFAAAGNPPSSRAWIAYAVAAAGVAAGVAGYLTGRRRSRRGVPRRRLRTRRPR